MHLVTRLGIAVASCLVVAAAVSRPLPASTEAAPRADEAQYSRRTDVIAPASAHQTQRKGEWSPVCGKTKEPLVDFGPIDHGRGRNRVLLTVHNCSAKAVALTRPEVFNPMAEDRPIQLDKAATDLRPLRLRPWESATVLLSWEPTDQGVPSERVGVRVAGIGPGELADELQLVNAKRVWLSGWYA